MKISRVVSVVDAREWVEVGDRWEPVPGSGRLNSCERCGRDHEIHATVELEDSRLVVVGTGCMSADSLDRRKAASTATKIAKLEALLARRRAQWDEYRAADAAVRSMELPAASTSLDPIQGVRRWRADVGDAKAFSYTSPWEAERVAESAWRQRRVLERVGHLSGIRFGDEIAAAERSLATARVALELVQRSLERGA